MDSIRESSVEEDIISEIRMLFSEDIENEKCVVLVEGSSDVKLLERMFDDNVVCRETFAGKHGLTRLIGRSELNSDRIIAIRDRDYIDISLLPERVFVYDHCCMEMMLLANSEVVSSMYVYYNGSKRKNEFLINILRNLAPYSVLRKRNEIDSLGHSFKNVGFGNLIGNDDSLNTELLFQQRIHVSQELHESCFRESETIEDDRLWDITNGHDVCTYLGLLSKIDNAALSKLQIQQILIATYRKCDFEQTQLYQDIIAYQSEKNIRYIS